MPILASTGLKYSNAIEKMSWTQTIQLCEEHNVFKIRKTNHFLFLFSFAGRLLVQNMLEIVHIFSTLNQNRF